MQSLAQGFAMTSAGVKVKEKTKNQENLLTLALPNQSNAVIYYITSAFWFSSLTQTEKMRTGQEGAEGAALQKSFSTEFFMYRGLTLVHVKSQKMCSKNKISFISLTFKENI